MHMDRLFQNYLSFYNDDETLKRNFELSHFYARSTSDKDYNTFKSILEKKKKMVIFWMA